MTSDCDKTIWIIAGESSGDAYGAELAIALKKMRPGLRLAGMGAGRMRAAGVDIMVDSSELGIVGIIEVLRSVPFFLRLLRQMTERAIAERPEAVVLIDYPGFNIRLAQRLHRAGIHVVYYISPQVWAWKKGRIPKIAASVERMLCIFPFEPAVYEGSGMRADFVGHPLLQILAPLKKPDVRRDDTLVLLLPGSRGSELKAHMKIFLKTAEQLKRDCPQIHFAMPLPREKNVALARQLMADAGVPASLLDEITLSVGNARELMTRAVAGLAASGTVTVEAAILGMPVVVAYHVNWLTYQIAKKLVKLPSITIANLVTGRTVFEERLQYDAVPEKIAPAVLAVMPGGSRREQVLQGMADCVTKLGGTASVSQKVAQEVMDVAERKDSGYNP